MSGSVSDAPFTYTPGMAMPGEGDRSADLLRQTRREISDLVREVAELASQPIPQQSFFAALLDRTVRALAAEGAVIWLRSGGRFQPLLRTGRLTDRQISAAGKSAHEAMLSEVLASGRPVVVPPTPIDSADQTPLRGEASVSAACIPANPTDRPAAVVPLVDPLASDTDDSPRYVLEVFLEPDAGVATQRGYLRFTAQMADLAGDFLRLDELRRGRRLAVVQQRLTDAVPRLYQHKRLGACAEALTDVAAELFQVARVSLIRLPPGDADDVEAVEAQRRAKRGQVVAISHVSTLDRRGTACRDLVRLAAAIPLGEPGHCVGEGSMVRDQPLTPSPSPLRSSGARGAIALGAEVRGATVRFCQPEGAEPDAAGLVPLAVVSLGTRDRYRLLFQGTTAGELPETHRELLENFAVIAAEALWTAERWEAVPLARLWSRAGVGEREPTPWLDGSIVRRVVLVTALAATVILTAWLPTPMEVVLSAHLRPGDVRIHYAPSQGIVQRIDIKHGERVSTGQTLVVLQDLALEEQTTELLGRRAVVAEKLARVRASLITAPHSSSPRRSGPHDDQPSSDESLIQQQRVLEEERSGIEQQLDLLAQAQQRLVIRADRDGFVDAWQTEQLALGRPVQIGEALVRVQPVDASWVVDARVPQNRRQMVLDRLVSGQSDVQLRIGDGEGPAAIARFSRPLGMQASPTGGSDTVVELLVESPPSSSDPLTWTNGMPAEVTVDCGQMPLAKVLFFDLIRSLRLQWARWT